MTGNVFLLCDSEAMIAKIVLRDSMFLKTNVHMVYISLHCTCMYIRKVHRRKQSDKLYTCTDFTCVIIHVICTYMYRFYLCDNTCNLYIHVQVLLV